MPDDNKRETHHMGEGQQDRGNQQMPGRKPQEDRLAPEKSGGNERKGSQFESDVERNRQDKGYKEGGQNEETRR